MCRIHRLASWEISPSTAGGQFFVPLMSDLVHAHICYVSGIDFYTQNKVCPFEVTISYDTYVFPFRPPPPSGNRKTPLGTRPLSTCRHTIEYSIHCVSFTSTNVYHTISCTYTLRHPQLCYRFDWPELAAPLPSISSNSAFEYRIHCSYTFSKPPCRQSTVSSPSISCTQ